MLILTRKPGEVIYIGDNIKVIVVEIKGNQIRLGIEAPADFRIFRKEIYDQIQEENRAAAIVDVGGALDGLSEAWKERKEKVETPGVSRSPLSQFTTQKVKTDAMQVIKRKKRPEGHTDE